MSTTGDLVSRIYSNFRGVDFRGEEVNLARSPDSLNMWKDYRNTDRVQTRPGKANFVSVLPGNYETIYGIFRYDGAMLIHRGNELRKYVGNTNYATLYDKMNKNESHAFVFGDKFYIIDGKNYLVYNGESVTEVVGYIPTTSIGRKPSGGGEGHEDVNLLSPWRINTFYGDGESNAYYLDTKDVVNAKGSVKVEVDGVTLGEERYTVIPQRGLIIFLTTGGTGWEAPPVSSDGKPNVKITFRTEIDDDFEKNYAARIKNCTLCQVFDNRVFFSGNDDYPNILWHSNLYDPTYWSDTDYYEEGLDSARIRGLVAGNNALWVFREPSDANTTVFYHTPTIDADYGKIYPSQHSSITTGCVGKVINFNDDIIFFSDRGMEGIHGDVTTEQVIEHRSSLVDRKMLQEEKYKDMILVKWEGYLLVFIGSHVYLADSRAVFNNVDHVEYEWFYWEMSFAVTTAAVIDGILYLGLVNGAIYQMEAETKAEEIESYWTTPKDKFNAPNKLKTTNKNGCVVEATGEMEVLAKTDNDDVFESIGKYKNVGDFVVSRIKKKKFKDIQLRFHSNTWFTLETATLECFVGGYIKRGGGE